MFDVERAPAEWRAGLKGGEALCGSDLDELESHLRGGIEARVARGFSEEEAFVVARHDLGSGGPWRPSLARSTAA